VGRRLLYHPDPSRVIIWGYSPPPPFTSVSRRIKHIGSVVKKFKGDRKKEIWFAVLFHSVHIRQEGNRITLHTRVTQFYKCLRKLMGRILESN